MRVVAVEPTPDLAKTCRAKGLEVIESRIEDAKGLGVVDVIASFEVIEHLFDPSELAVFMPEPDGLRLTEVEELLRDLAARTRVAGLGLTGLVRDPANEPKLALLAGALGW